MKKITFLSLLFLSLTVGFSACLDFMQTGEEGSGNVVKENRAVSDFNSISVSEGIHAYVTIGDEENAVVEADDNLVELIETKVDGGKLYIRIKNGFGVKSSKALNVYVNAKNLTRLQSSSASMITMESDIDATALKVEASSAGRIETKNIETPSLDGNASSSGTISIQNIVTNAADLNASSGGNIKMTSGAIAKLTAEASSSGDVLAKEVVTKVCAANASSGGNIQVNVSDELSARASSGGGISYAGSPQMKDLNTSSGGRVTKN